MSFCIHGNVKGVRLLLQCPGIEVNWRDPNEQTPLVVAAAGGHQEIFDMLISAPSFDPEKSDCRMAFCESVSSESPIPLKLLEFDFDVNRVVFVRMNGLQCLTLRLVQVIAF
jgi:ankyrin repeat protein